MPTGLKRHQTSDHDHFITICCYHRKPFFKTPASRDLFETALEQTRRRYDFQVLAYVIMPEHVHLLVSEPSSKQLATALQALKLSVSKQSKQRPSIHLQLHRGWLGVLSRLQHSLAHPTPICETPPTPRIYLMPAATANRDSSAEPKSALKTASTLVELTKNLLLIALCCYLFFHARSAINTVLQGVKDGKQNPRKRRRVHLRAGKASGPDTWRHAPESWPQLHSRPLHRSSSSSDLHFRQKRPLRSGAMGDRPRTLHAFRLT